MSPSGVDSACRFLLNCQWILHFYFRIMPIISKDLCTCMYIWLVEIYFGWFFSNWWNELTVMWSWCMNVLYMEMSPGFLWYCLMHFIFIIVKCNKSFHILCTKYYFEVFCQIQCVFLVLPKNSLPGLIS